MGSSSTKKSTKTVLNSNMDDMEFDPQVMLEKDGIDGMEFDTEMSRQPSRMTQRTN